MGEIVGSGFAAGDEGFGHFLPAVTGGDAADFAYRAAAVVARADEDRKGQAAEFAFAGVVGAIEEILEHTRHITEIFRRADQQALAGEQVVDARLVGTQAQCGGVTAACGAAQHRSSELAGAAALGVMDNEQAGAECFRHG